MFHANLYDGKDKLSTNKYRILHTNNTKTSLHSESLPSISPSQNPPIDCLSTEGG